MAAEVLLSRLSNRAWTDTPVLSQVAGNQYIAFGRRTPEEPPHRRDDIATLASTRSRGSFGQSPNAGLIAVPLGNTHPR